MNQYTGDGIMALFGAPIAHEDHAQRACYASLHLRQTMRDFGRDINRQHGLDSATRIGLNSGDVVVGRIGDDLRMDYTAQGHTVINEATPCGNRQTLSRSNSNFAPWAARYADIRLLPDEFEKYPLPTLRHDNPTQTSRRPERATVLPNSLALRAGCVPLYP